MASKWWGWGEEGKAYHLPDPERVWSYIHTRLGPTEASSRLDSLEGVQLRPPRLTAGVTSALGPGGVMNPGKLVPELSTNASPPAAGTEGADA